MNPLLQDFLTAMARKALTIAATYLVTVGWLETGDAERYAAGGALLIVSLVWSLWQRYHDRIKFLAALDATPGTPERLVVAKAKGTPPGILLGLLALVGLGIGFAGCAPASSGLRRVAIANESAAQTIARVQLTADQLEQLQLACLAEHVSTPAVCQGVGLTPVQRSALSPYIVRLAEGGLALNRAIVALDTPGARAQVVGLLTVLADTTRAVDGLPTNARLALLVAVEAARAALLVLSTGV